MILGEKLRVDDKHSSWFDFDCDIFAIWVVCVIIVHVVHFLLSKLLERVENSFVSSQFEIVMLDLYIYIYFQYLGGMIVHENCQVSFILAGSNLLLPCDWPGL